jgi:hypothetical protein
MWFMPGLLRPQVVAVEGVKPYIFDSGLTFRLGSSKPLASCRAKCESNIPAPCIIRLCQGFLLGQGYGGTGRRDGRDEPWRPAR